MSLPSRFTDRIVRLILCGMSAALFSACAPTSRLLKAPASGTDTAPNLQTRANDGVEVTLHRVIVRNDSASWVRDAEWDEYVVSVRSDSAAPVQLRAVELASELLATGQHTVLPDALKSQSTKNVETLKSAGRAVMVGYAGIATASILALSSVGYAVVTPLLPVAVLVAGISAYRSQSQSNADDAAIERTLISRGFQLPASLDQGTRLQRSAFFPITPAPRRLLLRYELAGVEREVTLDLAQFSDLHLDPLAQTLPARSSALTPAPSVVR
ncbi:MAG: hypothetical protein V4792_18515 [Pseudomonadota bacterium]